MKTIYGYDEVRKFIIADTKLVGTGHDNEYRYNNILFIVEKSCLHVRIYTDYTKNTCIASMIFFYHDFAMQYDTKSSNVTLVSRHGEKVSNEMYISIKDIIA